MCEKKSSPAFKPGTVKLSGLTEFRPEKPVMFDPPETMYVWDDDDVADGDGGSAPYFASVVYVNPNMSVHGVLAHGDGLSARNMGASWDHCARITSFGADAIPAPKDNSDPGYRSYHNTPKEV